MLKEKKLYILSFASIMMSVILGIVDVTGAGILQRYTVDMTWGIWFAAALLLLAWAEHAVEHGTLKTFMLFMTAVCLLQAAYGFGVILGNGDLSVNIRTANPQLYYYLQELVTF